MEDVRIIALGRNCFLGPVYTGHAYDYSQRWVGHECENGYVREVTPDIFDSTSGQKIAVPYCAGCGAQFGFEVIARACFHARREGFDLVSGWHIFQAKYENGGAPMLDTIR